MKKLFIIGLLLCATVGAQAQVAARSYKFLPSDVKALIITNTISVTNLNSTSVTTNFLSTTYTNNYNQRVILTNSTKNLFQDVPLFSLRDGSGAWQVQSNASTLPYISFATLSVTWLTGSGANSANQLQFTPVYDGVNESQTAADIWTIGIAATASSRQTLTTNVPLWRWPGASALRCRWAASVDADASSATTLLDLSLNAFVPTGN